jgi:hypothetical protein
MTFNTSKYTIEDIDSLYNWHKTWPTIQLRYFNNDYKIRREKQIEDFVSLNEFKKIKMYLDNNVLKDLNKLQVSTDEQADLIIITDQTFSRYPCNEIINQIKSKLYNCPNLYLCLNRYYINIDNSFRDETLDDNNNLAITQWLKKSLGEFTIIDMSLDYEDNGKWFTWVIPDRHYFITKDRK